MDYFLKEPQKPKTPGLIVVRCSVEFDEKTSVEQVLDICDYMDKQYTAPGYHQEIIRFCRNRFGEALSFLKFDENKHVQDYYPTSYHMIYFLTPVPQEKKPSIGRLQSLFDQKIKPYAQP